LVKLRTRNYFFYSFFMNMLDDKGDMRYNAPDYRLYWGQGA
jgi:hypothetical protein